MQWGHLVSSAAGVGSRSVRYRLIFVQKTAQDARQFVVRRFWVLFGFQMHLLGVKLDSFRTLKVQWGTYVLRRLVFRPSHVFKNSTGRSPILCSAVLASLGPFLGPNMHLKRKMSDVFVRVCWSVFSFES